MVAKSTGNHPPQNGRKNQVRDLESIAQNSWILSKIRWEKSDPWCVWNPKSSGINWCRRFFHWKPWETKEFNLKFVDHAPLPWSICVAWCLGHPFFCEIIFFWKIIIHVLTGKFQNIPFLGQLTVREAIYMHPWPSASNVLLLFSSQSNILDTWYMRVTWYNIYIYLMFDTVSPGVFYPNFSHLYSLDSQHLWFGDDMLEPFWLNK